MYFVSLLVSTVFVGGVAFTLKAPSMPHLFPENWATMTPATRSSDLLRSAPTGYITLERHENGECEGEVSFVSGMGVGTCMVGLDSNGTAIGSIIYSDASVANDVLTFYSSAYATLDCSGEAVSNDKAVIPATCLPSDDGLQGYLYSYTEESAPWAEQDKGVVFQYYDTENHCISESVGNSFVWYPLKYCIKTDDATSFEFAFCSKDYLRMVLYSDSDCSQFQSSFTSKLTKCEKEDDDNSYYHTDDGFDTQSYTSQMCSQD